MSFFLKDIDKAAAEAANKKQNKADANANKEHISPTATTTTATTKRQTKSNNTSLKTYDFAPSLEDELLDKDSKTSKQGFYTYGKKADKSSKESVVKVVPEPKSSCLVRLNGQKKGANDNHPKTSTPNDYDPFHF